MRLSNISPKKYTLISSMVLLIAFPLLSVAHMKTSYHINKNVDLVPNNPQDPKSNRKVILITIDDGPSAYSKDIVATLTSHHAKAIFFVNGIQDKHSPGNIAYEAEAGFAIGNHTWNHPNLKKEKDLAIIKKEIDDETKLIVKRTGSRPRFFRAPYGIGTPYMKDLVKKDGMIYMTWSGTAKDWERNTRDEKIFIKNVLTDLHPGEILLIHEHEWTTKHLDKLLTTLEQKGYSFVDPDQITN